MKKLKTDFEKNELSNLATFGGGSSFDGYNKDKNAKDLRVLDRWREYSTNVDFMNLWYCEGVKESSDLIFGKDIYK